MKGMGELPRPFIRVQGLRTQRIQLRLQEKGKAKKPEDLSVALPPSLRPRPCYHGWFT